MWRKGLCLMIMAAVSNILYATGAGGAAAAIGAEQQKANNNKAAEMIYKGAISPKVFKSAEKFILEKFPEAKIEDWNAGSDGFVCYIGDDKKMVLKWNGEFIVVRSKLFSFKLFLRAIGRNGSKQ